MIAHARMDAMNVGTKEMAVSLQNLKTLQHPRVGIQDSSMDQWQEIARFSNNQS